MRYGRRGRPLERQAQGRSPSRGRVLATVTPELVRLITIQARHQVTARPCSSPGCHKSSSQSFLCRRRSSISARTERFWVTFMKLLVIKTRSRLHPIMLAVAITVAARQHLTLAAATMVAARQYLTLAAAATMVAVKQQLTLAAATMAAVKQQRLLQTRMVPKEPRLRQHHPLPLAKPQPPCRVTKFRLRSRWYRHRCSSSGAGLTGKLAPALPALQTPFTSTMP